MPRKIISRISFWFNWLGQWPLMGIVAIIIVMIFMRLFMLSTLGFYELIVILAYFLYLAAWPHAGVEKSHIRVLILHQKFSQRRRSLLDSITSFLSLGTCVIMVWACVSYGNNLHASGSILSTFVPLPKYFFPYLMAFSFIIYGAAIYMDFLGSLASLRGKK